MTQTSPTGPFTMLERKDREIGKFNVVQERRTTDLSCERVGRVISQISRGTQIARKKSYVCFICFVGMLYRCKDMGIFA